MLLIVIIWEMELTFNQIRTKKPLTFRPRKVYIVCCSNSNLIQQYPSININPNFGTQLKSSSKQAICGSDISLEYLGIVLLFIVSIKLHFTCLIFWEKDLQIKSQKNNICSNNKNKTQMVYKLPYSSSLSEKQFRKSQLKFQVTLVLQERFLM